MRIEYLRTLYVFWNLLKLLCVVQALPSLCTHAAHCLTKWYVSHTNNEAAAAVGACWVGFLCQWRSFRAGRWMIEGEGMGRKVSTFAQIQRPCFERAESRWQSFSVCAQCVSAATAFASCFAHQLKAECLPFFFQALRCNLTHQDNLARIRLSCDFLLSVSRVSMQKWKKKKWEGHKRN